jgi:hypothetical protein
VNSHAKRKLFAPGQIVCTPRAHAAFEQASEQVEPYLTRHLYGDWSELVEMEKRGNRRALRRKKGRVFSRFFLNDKTRFWIVSELDQSTTTVMLPEDY